MIEKAEIESKSKELGIHAANVQRDYVFGWLLAGLFHKDNPLSAQLILKGGNCFRKAYFEHARFSNDLDFSTLTEINPEDLHSFLKQACIYAKERSRVEFLPDESRITTRELAEDEKMMFEVRVYFKSFYGDEEVTIKVDLDIKEYDRILLPLQTRRLVHAYSDVEECRADLHCIKLEELLASKLKALLQRRHSPDLYDFVYSLFFQRTLNISRLEVITTFLKKTIYESNPQVAKSLLIDLPFDVIRTLWVDYLVCPNLSTIDFEDATKWFLSIIDELFALLQPQYAFVSGGGGARLSYFGSNNRNTIFEAGRLQRILRMVYDGLERKVEPYALAFKRRKDGVGREYFYAWDRSGGHSGHTGIKSFISEKVQSVEMTEEQFEPRFPIELTKGPGFFSGRSFSSRASIPLPRKTPATSSTIGQSYTIECPVCGKRFKRSSYDIKLNDHKDRFGNRCYGRFGRRV